MATRRLHHFRRSRQRYHRRAHGPLQQQGSGQDLAGHAIIGSWCGKKFRPEKLAKRPGFDCIPAVKYGALHEIKSPLILQPGPAALTDGLAALQAIIANAVN
jgi:hypothetical protein